MAEVLTKERFKTLDDPPLSIETLKVLKKQGFCYMTPVQAATIPLLLKAENVAVDAATGSGKTLAFVIPIVERLRNLSTPLKSHQVGALIISPTRELASQIFHVAEPFMKSLRKINMVLLVGGHDIAVDLAAVQEHGANVVVATPGRLLDIMERSEDLDFREAFRILILDEADRLLEMGFDRQWSQIRKRLSPQRTTGLFSATQTQAVEELKRAGGNFVRVETQNYVKTQNSFDGVSTKIPAGLNIEYLICEADQKSSQLAYFLLQHSSNKVIVYFMTCASVDYWGTVLPRIRLLKDVPMIALHGKLKQKAREKALEKFTSMPSGVLFCTDVAARGLDVPDVDWVVQYDPPQDPTMFVHRVGRTARMGRSGDAVVFLLPKEDSYPEFLRIRHIPVKERQQTLDVPNVIPMLREANMKDRDVMEKGLKAFVSFIRAYKEHHCNYIFQWKDLELGKIAMSFGLLQLPSMPELKRGTFTSEHFVPVEGIDLASIKYKDKAREKQRRRKQAQKDQAGGKGLGRKGTGDARDKSAKGQEHKSVKRLPNKKRVQRDYDELNNEYRLLKKLKKGTISESEFDQLVNE